jgi:hypothetical protein
MKNRQQEFIEAILYCADEEGITSDNATLLTLLLYKIDDLTDQLDCVQEQLDTIETKINKLI